MSKGEMKQRLNILPTGVDQAFDSILERIDRRCGPDLSPGKEALIWILYTKAISVDTLRYALAVEPENVQFDLDNLYSWKVISHLCCGLLEATSIHEDDFEDPFRMVRFTHTTLRRYLETAWKEHEQEHRILIYRKMLKSFAFKFNHSIFEPGETEAGHDFMGFAQGALRSFVRTIPSEEARRFALKDLEIDFQDEVWYSWEETYEKLKRAAGEQIPAEDVQSFEEELQLKLADFSSEELFIREVATVSWKRDLRMRTLTLLTLCGVSDLVARLMREPLVGFDPKMLLEDPNHLYYAVQHESIELIKAVLDAKLSDPTSRFEYVNEHGGISVQPDTNLSFAISKNRRDITKLLLDNGAPTNEYGPHGDTPIHVATARGSIEMISLLLENGANINQTMCGPMVGYEADFKQERKSWRPLHIACRQGRTQVAEFLTQHGADLNAQAMDGATPLHITASFGDDTTAYLDILRLLLTSNADVAIRDRKGKVAYQIAYERGFRQMATLLWDAMVSKNCAAISATGQRKILGHPSKPVTYRLKKNKPRKKIANASQPPSENPGTFEDADGFTDLGGKMNDYEISPCQSSEEDILLDNENDDDDDAIG